MLTAATSNHRSRRGTATFRGEAPGRETRLSCLLRHGLSAHAGSQCLGSGGVSADHWIELVHREAAGSREGSGSFCAGCHAARIPGAGVRTDAIQRSRPYPFAFENARIELAAIHCVSSQGKCTQRGERLRGQPKLLSSQIVGNTLNYTVFQEILKRVED